MDVKKQIIALTVCVLSIANFIYLSLHHFELRMGISGGQSVCNISQTFNCDTAAASSFSTFLSIPVAIWGLVGQIFLALLLIICLTGLNQNRPRVFNYSFYLSVVFAAVSVLMLSISVFQLGSFCPFCMVAYALSLVQAGILFTLRSDSGFFEDLKDLLSSHKWVAIMGIATLASSWLVNAMMLDNFGGSKIQPYIIESVENWKVNPTMVFDETTGLTTSKEPAKMTIVEFADFKCPHCKIASPTIHAFMHSRSGVKVIFKPFPLDADCNSVIQRGGDELRCQFPAAVFCAEELKQSGWKLHDWIFDNQEKWFAPANRSDVVKSMAEVVGLSSEELDKCISSEPIKARVKSNALEGSVAKIQGTPAIFVNGKKLDRGQFLSVLERVYDSL
jgi:protein-disulfide isomerase/uncharacterized membrane protein